MAKFGIGCEQVKRVLDSSGYSSVDVNVKAVMEQFGKSPALLTACFVEDGSVSVDGGSAYQHVCKWDASTAGNGDGTSYVLVDGVSVVQWHA